MRDFVQLVTELDDLTHQAKPISFISYLQKTKKQHKTNLSAWLQSDFSSLDSQKIPQTTQSNACIGFHKVSEVQQQYQLKSMDHRRLAEKMTKNMEPHFFSKQRGVVAAGLSKRVFSSRGNSKERLGIKEVVDEDESTGRFNHEQRGREKIKLSARLRAEGRLDEQEATGKFFDYDQNLYSVDKIREIILRGKEEKGNYETPTTAFPTKELRSKKKGNRLKFEYDNDEYVRTDVKKKSSRSGGRRGKQSKKSTLEKKRLKIDVDPVVKEDGGDHNHNRGAQKSSQRNNKASKNGGIFGSASQGQLGNYKTDQQIDLKARQQLFGSSRELPFSRKDPNFEHQIKAKKRQESLPMNSRSTSVLRSLRKKRSQSIKGSSSCNKRFRTHQKHQRMGSRGRKRGHKSYANLREEARPSNTGPNNKSLLVKVVKAEKILSNGQLKNYLKKMNVKKSRKRNRSGIIKLKATAATSGSRVAQKIFEVQKMSLKAAGNRGSCEEPGPHQTKKKSRR